MNYHHLRYFWVVAREGGLVPAGKVLRLSHPTLSAQIRALEAQLEEPLFHRTGRRLELTEMGQVVFRYAEEIFALGREMLDTVKGRGGGGGRLVRLDVGIADVVPKLVVRRLLSPALGLAEPVRIVCHERRFDALLADLAIHALDLVISDAPVPPGSNVRAFNHLLGETDVSFFGLAALARTYRPGFPRSLDGAPMLLPLESLTLRRALNQWFESHGITPRIVAEFEDSALLKVFGADGVGVFAAPSAVEAEILDQYGVELIGRVPQVREQFYAISVERRLKNPAVVAICEAARHELFAPPPRARARGAGKPRGRAPVRRS